MTGAFTGLAVRIMALSLVTALSELLLPEGGVKNAARTALNVAFASRALTYIVGIIGGTGV